MTEALDIAAGARLSIDLAAIRSNWRRLAARLAPGVNCAAVVKADAYGLGAEHVVPALVAEGCRTFFVAHLVEAYPLAGLLPAGARLFLLNGLMPGAEAACLAAGAIPVLNSLEQAKRWRALAQREGRPLPAALQIDSGMSRLGLSPLELDALLADGEFFGHVPLALVMSHLACADDPGHAANAAQRAAFEALAGRLPPAPRSLANSGGVFLPDAYHGDLARPGVALYGAAPVAGEANPMAQVVGLTARVVQVREVAAGQGVGYGLTFARKAPGRIATVAVGYADGWPRALSNRGAAWFKGVRLPIAGRVSMDSMGLDASALADQGLSLQLGDEVELIGPHQTLEDVAAAADTIPYEILTRLGRRYARTYLEAASSSASAAPTLEALAS